MAPWYEIPDGALVLPVDDDDWFAPNAAEILAREPAADGYVWPQAWVEVPTHLGHRLQVLRRRLVPSTPPYWTCATNSYALVKSAETERALANHVTASRWFDANPARVHRVDGRLSVANRTLASLTTLRPPNRGFSPARLRLRFHQYKRLYDRRLPPDLAWAQPYVDMMRDLMGELQIAPGKRPSHSSPNTRLQG